MDVVNILSRYLEFRWPLDMLSTVAGGLTGLVLVFVVDWLRKPRIKVLRFEKITVNFGILYKLRFKLGGFASPGVCRLRINWSDKSTFAKWDETPNPLGSDQLINFRPELVPLTFDQTLFHGVDYSVPIVIEVDGAREVFSGWWFGKPYGYGPEPGLDVGFTI